MSRLNIKTRLYAVATGQQSAGIDQINDAIANVDGVTQQNAALVEESAAAAKAVKQEVEELRRLVAFFHLEGAKPVAVANRRPSQPASVRPKKVGATVTALSAAQPTKARSARVAQQGGSEYLAGVLENFGSR